MNSSLRGRARLAAACIVLQALAGCTLHFERPQLYVVAVELLDARLTEQHFRVRVTVTNPNRSALPVRAISCALEVGGERFGRGQSEAFSVPAQGVAEFDMTVATDLAGALLKILPRLKDSTHPLDYRLTGEVLTDLAFLRSIPFDARGTLQ